METTIHRSVKPHEIPGPFRESRRDLNVQLDGGVTASWLEPDLGCTRLHGGQREREELVALQTDFRASGHLFA